MQRQSNTILDIPQASSPYILPVGSFPGLGLHFSNAAAVATVSVDVRRDGAFDQDITLVGTDKYRYPDTTGMYALYNAGFVKITWDVGTLSIIQKG